MKRIIDLLRTIKKLLMSPFLNMRIKKNRWVFGCWQGELYADNSKYMFEYVIENHPEIECIWISKKMSIVKKIRKKGYKAYCANSISGIIAASTAEVAFETTNNNDISIFLNGDKTIIINFWHGIGIKKLNDIGLNCEENHKKYWMVTSNQNKNRMKELTGADNSHFFITGYPRNDILINRKKPSLVINDIRSKYPNSKYILYVPTHRKFGKTSHFISEDSLLIVDKKLREKNIVMLLKPHFHELYKYQNIEPELTNIIIAKNIDKHSDVYQYMSDFDLLITDYSSIMYDYVITKKPVVLFPYDLEEYKNKDFGISEYYESVPIGPICKTWDSVVEKVEELLSSDTWLVKRENCRIFFNPLDDGKNCNRVYLCVLNILNSKI